MLLDGEPHLSGADMKTFSVGDRVVWVKYSNLKTWDEYEDTTRGTVKTVDTEGRLSVKWDDKWHNEKPVKLSPDALISEEEANQIRSKLEAEYEVWAGPIREKMQQAGQLLAEAGELAAKQKKDLAEMHEIISPLLEAMDDLGWSTSSLSC